MIMETSIKHGSDGGALVQQSSDSLLQLFCWISRHAAPPRLLLTESAHAATGTEIFQNKK